MSESFINTELTKKANIHPKDLCPHRDTIMASDHFASLFFTHVYFYHVVTHAQL